MLQGNPAKPKLLLQGECDDPADAHLPERGVMAEQRFPPLKTVGLGH
jgi:hypothetical protein